jgi:hypothetical protein
MSSPMNRFVERLGAFTARAREVVDNADFTDSDSATEYLQALQEVQMMNWATESSLKSRNGLLKKIMTELR